MERNVSPSARISAEAAEWFVRLQDADPSGATRAAFTQWLLNSPDHIQAFLHATQAWADLGAATDETTESLVLAARAESEPINVVPLPNVTAAPVSNSEPKPGTVRPWKYVAAAASLFVVVGLLAWFVAARWLDRTYIRTAVGEQRTLAMSDGSLLHVNADSELSIQLDAQERRVRLLRGEARFEVAKDAHRPFIVSTSNASVRAVGTIFNVQAVATRTAVTVLEGRVEVTGGTIANEDSSAAPERRSLKTQLAAGERASVIASGEILPNTGRSVESALAWSNRILVFRADTLADVVAEFNRYDIRAIRIADPALAGLSISGTFASNDSASLLLYLQRYHDVHVRTLPDGVRILSTAGDEK